MAGPRKPGKVTIRPAAPERIRLQISPLAEMAKRFRIAAVSLNLSETELFEKLIELNFPSLHVQNLSKSPFFGAAAVEQGGGADPLAERNQKVSEIGSSALRPLDDAVDELVQEDGVGYSPKLGSKSRFSA